MDTITRWHMVLVLSRQRHWLDVVTSSFANVPQHKSRQGKDPRQKGINNNNDTIHRANCLHVIFLFLKMPACCNCVMIIESLLIWWYMDNKNRKVLVDSHPELWSQCQRASTTFSRGSWLVLLIIIIFLSKPSKKIVVFLLSSPILLLKTH